MGGLCRSEDLRGRLKGVVDWNITLIPEYSIESGRFILLIGSMLVDKFDDR